MRKIFTAVIIFLIFSTSVKAQQPGNGIAAILDKEPANNAAELNANAAATARLGENGIAGMLAMLQPTGQGDNTKIFDAISGFSFYVTQKSRETWRSMAVKAYSAALAKEHDPENQAFIISQLQIAGKDDAIPALGKYLNNERLCDPSARALVKINSPAAKAALLKALPASKGVCRESLVEALGDSRNTLAVKSINATIGKDKRLTKVALYALANIAAPSSINLLANAAQQAKFTYDETNATSSYLLFINNMAHRGGAETAVRLAKTLMSKAGLANEVQTQTAALKLLADIQGPRSAPVLIAATHYNNAEYRAAALKFAGPNLTPANAALWIKEMNKAGDPQKAGIITMLGNNRVPAALPSIRKELKNKNTEVAVAAITASQKIGQDKVLPELLDVMATGNTNETVAAEKAILVMKGKGLTDKVADALPGAPANAKPLLIAILAERKAHDKINTVMPLLYSEDSSVRQAVFASLQDLAQQDNLQQLFALLAKETRTYETEKLQEAIMAVLAQMPGEKNLGNMVLQQMDNAPADKKPTYFKILAGVGDKPSLNAISKAYDNGDGPAKKMAVLALTEWSNGSAIRELLHVSKENTDAAMQNRAFGGLIALISRAEYPAEEKVIFLQEAMTAARTVEQKRSVLQEVSNDKTFPALVFLSNYLDDPQLQGEAANGVSNIALSNKDFYGGEVKQWLEKAILIKKGGDSDYEKVAIRKFIAEMPADAGFIPLFNNHNLEGWKGLIGNPIERGKMDAATLAKEQQKADDMMRKGWYVKDSVLNFSGEGENICTVKQYRNFDLYVDWKIESKGDAGIYLRGSPQVQIWDTSRVDVGAQVGSGGLYNNQAHESKPLKMADNAINEWNNFHIIMKDDKVTVYLNGVLVVDNVVMDNYWDRKLPIFPKEQIELQAHGTHVYYRDIYLRELPD